jgi:hypothetical protein
MPRRQRLLILYAHSPDLASPVCAWSEFSADSTIASGVGITNIPPFPTVVAALRAGWRVIQYPIAIPAFPGHEDDTGALKHEFVLEQIEELPDA